MPSQNIQSFLKQFGSDDQCLQHLFDNRFGQGHTCTKCEKESRWTRVTNEKAFACQWCGHHLYPMAGTIFQSSSTPLQMWFYAIFLFSKTRNGVSAKEIQRQLGVTYKTAWRIGHKIREYMASVDGENMLGGEGKIVEADELYLGGKAKMHEKNHNKIMVQGMVEKDGEVVTKIIPRNSKVKAAHIRHNVAENVEVGTELHTDELPAYKYLGDQYDHKTVQHGKKEYAIYEADGGVVTTNQIEGYFSQLRRTIEGTHIHISEKHAEKYAKETEYRYNRRKAEPAILNDLLTGFPKG